MTTVYQFFDDVGTLLYVGMTGNFARRLMAHSKAKHWYPSIRSITLRQFATRADAAREEARLIKSLRPCFNLNGFDLVKKSIVLTEDEAAAIDRVATDDGMKANSVVRQAIAEFLARRKAKQEAA